jgi:hypothetical protein
MQDSVIRGQSPKVVHNGVIEQVVCSCTDLGSRWERPLLGAWVAKRCPYGKAMLESLNLAARQQTHTTWQYLLDLLDYFPSVLGKKYKQDSRKCWTL